MKHADVAVIGGGIAGALTAAMLGRAGVSTMIVDLYPRYREDFRCEKIHDDQADLLRRTGIGEAVLAAATPIPVMWAARFGRLSGRLRHRGKPYEYGIAYDDLVNAVRDQIPDHVPFIHAKVTTISTSPDQQRLVLANGEVWSARLIVVATGLNNALVKDRAVRTEICKGHSISVGFDIAPHGLRCPALTYFANRDDIGYVTIFPIGSRMRVNLFAYRDYRDSWFNALRESPIAAMLREMPRLQRFLDPDTKVTSDVRIRPIDLYRTECAVQPGMVLVGDSFATSCPPAGTGLNKALTDTERLCHHYIPDWLKTPGMGRSKISEFYDDPVKIACDRWSEHEARYIKSMAVDRGTVWYARRVGWFLFDGIRTALALQMPQIPIFTRQAGQTGRAKQQG